MIGVCTGATGVWTAVFAVWVAPLGAGAEAVVVGAAAAAAGAAYPPPAEGAADIAGTDTRLKAVAASVNLSANVFIEQHKPDVASETYGLLLIG